MSAGLLTTRDIAAQFGVSRYTVTARWTKRPDFPRPKVDINPWSRKWAANEVEQWAKGEKQSRSRTA
jgi:predicted DNA-binding transcriptional regulator AlpA